MAAYLQRSSNYVLYFLYYTINYEKTWLQYETGSQLKPYCLKHFSVPFCNPFNCRFKKGLKTNSIKNYCFLPMYYFYSVYRYIIASTIIMHNGNSNKCLNLQQNKLFIGVFFNSGL